MITNIEGEVWKSIDGYSNYKVSNFGRIKRLVGHYCKEERLLNPYINKLGYPVVSLSFNGCQYPYYVHRLVYKAFNEDKIYVRHINGNRKDSRLENLS